MIQTDATSLMLIGGLFVLLGIITIVWDRLEKNKYLNNISHHVDIREYLDGWPPRPQFGALKTGGWIAVIIGIILAGVGLAFRIWG